MLKRGIRTQQYSTLQHCASISAIDGFLVNTLVLQLQYRVHMKLSHRFTFTHSILHSFHCIGNTSVLTSLLYVSVDVTAIPQRWRHCSTSALTSPQYVSADVNAVRHHWRQRSTSPLMSLQYVSADVNAVFVFTKNWSRVRRKNWLKYYISWRDAAVYEDKALSFPTPTITNQLFSEPPDYHITGRKPEDFAST